MKWPFLDKVPNSSKKGHFIKFYKKRRRKCTSEIEIIKKRPLHQKTSFFDEVAIS